MTIDEMLRSENHQTYLAGSKMLESLPRQEAATLLYGLADSNNDLLRVRALRQLGKYDPDRANSLALEILREPDSIYHVSALYSVWERHMKQAIPEARNILISHTNPITRTWAAVYLGDCGGASELPVLTQALTDNGTDHEGRTVSSIAAESIRQIRAREGINEPAVK